MSSQTLKTILEQGDADWISQGMIQTFDRSEIPVQGDILYALGETGNLETRRGVEQCIRNLEHEDLKEAAQDAIDSITSRSP